MIVARVIAPRRYCSDRTCGGTDCLTCYGANAEVLVDVRVDGVSLHPQAVEELLADGVGVGEAVREAVWRALHPGARVDLGDAGAATDSATDDLLPF